MRTTDRKEKGQDGVTDAGGIQASRVNGITFSYGSVAEERKPGLGKRALDSVVPLGQGLSLLLPPSVCVRITLLPQSLFACLFS